MDSCGSLAPGNLAEAAGPCGSVPGAWLPQVGFGSLPGGSSSPYSRLLRVLGDSALAQLFWEASPAPPRPSQCLDGGMGGWEVVLPAAWLGSQALPLSS